MLCLKSVGPILVIFSYYVIYGKLSFTICAEYQLYRLSKSYLMIVCARVQHARKFSLLASALSMLALTAKDLLPACLLLLPKQHQLQ
jgi:hypothetical protein